MLKRITAVVLLGCVMLLSQSRAQNPPTASTMPNLTALLAKARERIAEYKRVFRDLTATETRTTEVFYRDGKLDDRRTTSADFIVYQSRFDEQVIHECRLFNLIDGKRVNEDEPQVQRFFAKLAQAKSKQQEMALIKEKNTEHYFRFYRFNQTIMPVWLLQAITTTSSYDLAVVGREQVLGRDCILVAYRHKEGATLPDTELFSRQVGDEFKRGQAFWRGRLWLDAQTGELCRLERELYISYADTTTPLVAMYDLMEFAPSDYSIPVPRRSVTKWNFHAWREKGGARKLGLKCRFTDEYSTFKRFSATGQEDEKKQIVKPN